MTRVIGALVGDIRNEASARTKYGLLFAELARQFELVDVYDATLRGAARWVNALQTFHPHRATWKERFYQNVPAFIARSQRAASALRDRADVIVQEGVLFDVSAAQTPVVIYTDYTATLAARRVDAGRSPFNAQQRAQWIALERLALERAAHICVRGRFVREAIIAEYHVAPERVTAIGGGVNLARLPDNAALSARFQSNRRRGVRPTALFIGKDFWRKGGDLMLRAFAIARSRVTDARLVMVTAGPVPADLPRAGVEFIAPTWDRAVIEALYREADVFVLPSRLETWGDVLLEAMAFGLPCLGVAGEAMDEIIVDGVTGAIVPPNDVEALAEQLTRVLCDRDRARSWGLAGRQRVEAEFTWARVVARLAIVIRAVLI